MLLPNSGTSMRFLRPSRTTTGSLTHLTSKEMEVRTMLDAQPLTQDGGNCSDMKIISLRTRKEKCLTFKVTLMLKTETSSCTLHTEESTKCGMLSMLMNGRESQERVSSTKTLVFTLKDLSMLSLLCHKEDILT